MVVDITERDSKQTPKRCLNERAEVLSVLAVSQLISPVFSYVHIQRTDELVRERYPSN